MGFFSDLRALYSAIPCPVYPGEEIIDSGFPIHPSTSELSESLLIDPEALKLETYEPGLYDESGDYYPQFTDDPSALPEAFVPNDLSAPVNSGGTEPESVPADSSKSSNSEASNVSDNSE